MNNRLALTVPYAYNSEKRLVHAGEANQQDDHWCPACNNRVILRRGAIRTPHFAHAAQGGCRSQETLTHSIAKLLIQQVVTDWVSGQGNVPVIAYQCQGCQKGKIFDAPPPDTTTDALLERPLDGFRGDVVLYADDTPILNIEVYVTHAVDEVKAQMLPIPWIEVDGTAILEDPYTWRVRATSQETGLRCAACQMHQSEQKVERKVEWRTKQKRGLMYQPDLRRNRTQSTQISADRQPSAQSDADGSTTGQTERLQNRHIFWQALCRVAKATGLKSSQLPRSYYRYTVGRCWSCNREILLYTWPGHTLYPTQPPEQKPIPPTLCERRQKGQIIWVNRCHYCNKTQDDYYLYDDKGSGVFSLFRIGADTEEDFREDMQELAGWYANRSSCPDTGTLEQEYD